MSKNQSSAANAQGASPGTPASVALRRIAWLQAGAGLAGIVLGTLATGQPPAWARICMGTLGAVMLLLGALGPARIVVRGLKLPAEIMSAIRVQALFLVLTGAGLLAVAAVGAGTRIGLLALGLGALVAAYFGFFKLSLRMPDTFYFYEMVSIIRSAGVTAEAKDSVADRAFRRWSPGSAAGVAVGTSAPDGPVTTLGGEAGMLSDYLQADECPLVLNLGSYTCPHHRKRLPELEALMAQWQPKGVRFLTVYTAEAHVEDGWKLQAQYDADAEFTQESDFCFFYANSLQERQAMAERMVGAKAFSMAVVLDSMDDELLNKYNSWPIRLYVIKAGKVIYSGAQGPFGYDPKGVDAVLHTLVSG